jgi:uracil-DNA glycosylase family 4
MKHGDIALQRLRETVCDCRDCPRLVAWREEVAQKRKRAFQSQSYWGRPVPGFGDPRARLLIVGLAPAAHGANRTGRMFTGDRSGDWLYRALFKAGFSNQPTSEAVGDGLTLNDAYITAVVRCAPPLNKPTRDERDRCLGFLDRELNALDAVKIVISLGAFAWAGFLTLLNKRGHTVKPRPRFAHLAETRPGPYALLGSYHPSQQNTFTGKLTEPMFDAVFQRARELLATV